MLWLYATARRVIVNHHRKAQRRDRLVDRIGANLAEGVTQLDPSEGNAVESMLALARLSDDDRELLMLAGLGGSGFRAARLCPRLFASSRAGSAVPRTLPLERGTRRSRRVDETTGSITTIAATSGSTRRRAREGGSTMNPFHELQNADPVQSLDVEALSADPLFDELFASIVSESRISASEGIEDDHAPIHLGRRPEQLRHRQRLALSVAAVVVVVTASFAAVIGTSSTGGPTTTAWRAARSLPSREHFTSPHGPSGSWQLVGDVVSAGWQQNTAGPPPSTLTCPTTTACYALADNYSSANGNAPLTSESLYVSNDFGTSWSVLPLPSGFLATTPLACSDALSCSAGALINGQSVFVATTDGGHQWTTNPLSGLSGLSGLLAALDCSSATDCHGILGPSVPSGSTAAEVHAALLASGESFVTTVNGGQSWTSSALPVTGLVSDFACYDASNCIVMGDDLTTPTTTSTAAQAFALSTSDGGATWTNGTLPANNLRTRNAISCSSALDCAALSSLDATPVFLTTSDGGATWQSQAFPGDVPQPLMAGVACSSASDCWVAGSEAVTVTIGNTTDGDSAVILGTTDGGLSWSKVTFTVPPGAPNYEGQSYQGIGPISCPTENACIALGETARGAPETPVYTIAGPGTGNTGTAGSSGSSSS